MKPKTVTVDEALKMIEEFQASCDLDDLTKLLSTLYEGAYIVKSEDGVLSDVFRGGARLGPYRTDPKTKQG